jgi:hypothetical protein
VGCGFLKPKTLPEFCGQSRLRTKILKLDLAILMCRGDMLDDCWRTTGSTHQVFVSESHFVTRCGFF